MKTIAFIIALLTLLMTSTAMADSFNSIYNNTQQMINQSNMQAQQDAANYQMRQEMQKQRNQQEWDSFQQLQEMRRQTEQMERMNRGR